MRKAESKDTIKMEGDFENTKFEMNEKIMLRDAYQAVSVADAWDWLKEPSTPGHMGFMFSDDPMIKNIRENITYTGHSGASFAMTMRNMQLIAKKGWVEFYRSVRLPPPCYCRDLKGFKTGWCGVAGGGVPACEH